MLTTAMATQISAIRITWAVLTELLLVRRDARNEPKSSTALGVTALDDQKWSVTAVAPMPSPIEPRPMARFVHAVMLGWMPCCASLASTCLSISELILSTSPSATAPSYAWPSSVCAAAAAATSSCACTSMQPSYIAIEWPDNRLRRGHSCCRGADGDQLDAAPEVDGRRDTVLSLAATAHFDRLCI